MALQLGKRLHIREIPWALEHPETILLWENAFPSSVRCTLTPEPVRVNASSGLCYDERRESSGNMSILAICCDCDESVTLVVDIARALVCPMRRFTTLAHCLVI